MLLLVQVGWISSPPGLCTTKSSLTQNIQFVDQLLGHDVHGSSRDVMCGVVMCEMGS
jgi:hypothetical protein